MTTARSNLSGLLPASSHLTLAQPWPEGTQPVKRPQRRIPPDGRDVLTNSEWTAVGLALRLSPRELQIVQAVFDDKKEAAIADDLGISSHTVHTHLERLYRKVGARGRTTMAVRVLAEHLRLISPTRSAEA
ncbi:MAG: helix-turn-helix transcriptional regulator [Phycisphaerae bacterium]|nr:helix-turn-helix transcriptional regulator [Phycisphaerae bacterium]